MLDIINHKRNIPLLFINRVSPQDEIKGLDLIKHNEKAYDYCEYQWQKATEYINKKKTISSDTKTAEGIFWDGKMVRSSKDYNKDSGKVGPLPPIV